MFASTVVLGNDKISPNSKTAYFGDFEKRKNLRHKVSQKCLILQNLRKKRIFDHSEAFQRLHTNGGGYEEISKFPKIVDIDESTKATWQFSGWVVC